MSESGLIRKRGEKNRYINVKNQKIIITVMRREKIIHNEKF